MNLIESIQYNSGVLEESVSEDLINKYLQMSKVEDWKNLKISPLTKLRLKNAIDRKDYGKTLELLGKAAKEQTRNTIGKYDNRSFIAKAKDFFVDGWEETVTSIKTNNYLDLFQIPLIQLVLAVGGVALLVKFIKNIIKRKKNENAK